MKRTRLTVLAFIPCFAFFPGCASNRYKGSLSCISYVETSEETDLVNLTEDAKKQFFPCSIRENGKTILPIVGVISNLQQRMQQFGIIHGVEFLTTSLIIAQCICPMQIKGLSIHCLVFQSPRKRGTKRRHDKLTDCKKQKEYGQNVCTPFAFCNAKLHYQAYFII